MSNRSDPQADFEAFVVRSSQGLLRFAFLLTGDRGHAEDLLQVALLRVSRRWTVARETPEAFARTVLVNLARDRWRWLKRRPREVSWDRVPDPVVPESTVVSLREEDVLRAVRRLPAHQKAVLVLRYFEELSVAEAAEVLGCSEGTIKSQTHRAIGGLREQLRREVYREGVDPPSERPPPRGAYAIPTSLAAPAQEDLP